MQDIFTPEVHLSAGSQELRQRDVSGLALAGLALLMALVAQGEVGAGRIGNSLALYLVAAGLYLASRPRSPWRVRHQAASPSLSSKSLPVALLGLAAATVPTIGASFVFRARPEATTPWLLYILAMLALLTTAWYLAGEERQAGQWSGDAGTAEGHPAAPGPQERGARVVGFGLREALLLAVLLVAAFMRLYRLSQFPAGVFSDEAVNGLDALRVLQQRWYPAYFPDNFGRAPLYEYLLAASFALGGANELTLRLPTVFAGILSVALIYRLARLWFEPALAIIPALLLATSTWHATFSRIAFDAILDPLFLILSLLLLLQALRSGRPSLYLLSGLSLGLGLLTYTAFRLAPLLILGTIALFLAYRRLSLASAAQGTAVLLLACFIAASPLVNYASANPSTFWQRTKTASVLRGRSLRAAAPDILSNAVKHLGMFNFKGDSNGRHNLPGRPMLHPLVAALFALGLVACLSFWRTPEALLLLAWLGLGLAAGVFSIAFEAPQALRSIGAIPAACLIASLPVVELWRRWRDAFGAKRWRALLPLLLAACLWLLLGSYQAFFVRQAEDFAVWNAFSTAETHLAREVNRLGPDYDYYIDPELSRSATVRFLAPWFQEPIPYAPSEVLPIVAPGPSGSVVFVGEENRSLIELFARWYPHVTTIAHANPVDGHASMFEYVLRPADVAAVQGLDLRQSYPGADLGVQAVPRLEWQAGPGEAAPYQLTWQGALLVPRSGVYRLVLRAAGKGSLMLDGSPLLALPGKGQEMEATAGVALARGLHALLVQVQPASGGSVALLWQPPGALQLVPVPSQCLYRSPVQAGGLRGDYLPGESDAWPSPVEDGLPSPAFSRIDPFVDFYFHITPLERPYRVRWRGWLVPPQAGQYALTLQARDRAELWLAGELVLSTQRPEEPVSLTRALAGPVPIEVRFWDETGYTGVRLSWKRPDGVEEVIPSTALAPPAPTPLP